MNCSAIPFAHHSDRVDGVDQRVGVVGEQVATHFADHPDSRGGHGLEVPVNSDIALRSVSAQSTQDRLDLGQDSRIADSHEHDGFPGHA